MYTPVKGSPSEARVWARASAARIHVSAAVITWPHSQAASGLSVLLTIANASPSAHVMGWPSRVTNGRTVRVTSGETSAR